MQQLRKFRKTELGEIPQGWQVSRLGNFVDILVGFPFASKEYSDSGIRLVRGDNITEGRLRWEDRTRYWNKMTSQLRKFLLQKGDFLIGMDGSKVGKNYAQVNEEDLPCLLVQRVACLRANERLIQNYLNYIIGSKGFRDYVESTKTDAAIPHISSRQIREFKILVPPIEEQQKIIYILSKTEELIQKTDQIIEQTQRLKKGLMQKLLTKGIGHAKFDNTLIDNKRVLLPSGWRISNLKMCTLKIGSGITPKGGSKVYQEKGIPLIRSQNVHFDGLRLDDVAYISEAIHNEMKNSKLIEGDVLLNITGASLGRCTIVPLGFGEGNVNQHVCIIRPSNTLDSVYLSLFLSSDLGQNMIFRTNQGLSREGLNYQQIGDFQIPIPPLAEQKRIASITSLINMKIQNRITYKAVVQLLKVGLMQKLLTGKIRIKV